jgi:hypothetical protein
MFDITLISTRHEDAGACTSQELYKILEELRPEVIFLELPPSYLLKRFIDRTHTSLETEAVRIYIDKYKLVIVAVDIDDVPDSNFFEEYKRAFERVEWLADVNGINLRNASDANRQYTRMYGFNYLNSDHSITDYEAHKDALEQGLKQINDERLNKAYQAWTEVNERRENEMLQNIYDYCKDWHFERAVFLLGAAHRKSMIDKIDHRENTETLKLNWFLYCLETPLKSEP